MKVFITVALSIAVLLQLSDAGFYRNKRQSVTVFPEISGNNPIFDIDPILDLLQGAQNTIVNILKNLTNFLSGSTENAVKTIQNLRQAIFNTTQSQIDKALQTIQNATQGAGRLIQNALEDGENKLLSIEEKAKSVADCLTSNVSDTRNIIQKAAETANNCVASRLNEAVDIFNRLIQRLTELGTAVFSLPNQISSCNQLQSGLFDFPGFIRKMTCLGNIPAKGISDAIQFFTTIGQGLGDVAAYAAGVPGAVFNCAQNITSEISQPVSQLLDEVTKCANGTQSS